MYEILNRISFEFLGKIDHYRLFAKDELDMVAEVVKNLETGQEIPKKYRIYLAIVGFRSKLAARELEIWIDRWSDLLSELPDIQSPGEDVREEILEGAKDYRRIFRQKSRMLRRVNGALHRSDVLEEGESQALGIVKEFLEKEVSDLER